VTDQYLRQFNSAGPCIERGPVTSESAKFWTVQDKFSGRPRRFGKGWRNHVEPCASCRDHPRTQYPNGYMD
jgi:hypothetical protein